MPLDPQKITLCWPNRIDEAVLSGGNWEAAQPLSLLKDRVIAVRAQSVDASAASTQFSLTLSAARPVQVLALAGHTLSAEARCRIRLYADDDQTQPLWDSGERDVWPALYSTAQLEWEYDTWWSGRLDEEARAEYTPLLTVFADEIQMTKAAHVELMDTTNPAGYVRLGRVVISDAWQPVYNASYGIQHGLDSATSVDEAGDRTEYFERKRLRRTAALSLEHLDETEAYQRLFSLRRTEGIHGEILYAFGLQETPENFIRTFMARQQQLDPLEHPYHATHSTDLNLLEIL